MAFETLIVADRGPIRIITVNRPEVLNALNSKVLSELDAAAADVENHPEIRAVIITGAGEKAFVAGADIGEMKSLRPAKAQALSTKGHRVMNRIEELGVPVIAAVNGFALGGGLELALACDFIYASEKAFLGLVEVNLGLVPGFGGVARLSRRVGVAQARELLFTAKMLKAKDALTLGLVNKVVDGDVVDEAVKTAQIIAGKGPYAVAVVKRMLLDGQDADQHAANRLEQHSFGLVFGTDDKAEGVAAFLEKRTPTFKGC
ncbi:MAG: enoyl-CoA hydratase/isomerase family protein [Deltaproteobacteria bacterium]|nr:enoyl-CoA hydratase/isomerase family protein [Deltaproteobacteria bacterium]